MTTNLEPSHPTSDGDDNRRNGTLIQLKTKGEIEAADKTINVYVVEIPIKSASVVLKLLRDAIPNQESVDLQHLRRFAKQEFLPDHLKSFSTPGNGNQSSPLSANPRTGTAYLLICPTHLIPQDDLSTLLSANPPFSDLPPPTILTLPVPLYSSTSLAQAAAWSRTHWPTSFKNTNPHGPHPPFVARAEVGLLRDGGRDMRKLVELARKAGDEAAMARKGPGVGCVIFGREKRGDGTAEAVAVAGDARWGLEGNGCGEGRGAGNVMAHAVMRAIGMVARKRLRLDGAEDATSQTSPNPFADLPRNELEKTVFDADTLNSGGYLCVDLEIYTTQEPCIMCCMAVLHSRFSRCLFGRKMPRTGAWMAESGLGYGLFWRPELNWKLLCWQWDDGEEKVDAKSCNQSPPLAR
ncbi:cytidine deaminase-like protein [Aulographum hederae CBS 113979]|uniref:Cytidine deaminase-like protein n=1 Tax=Aulographum hederae CBS 113979 TaxID=1176131 RepID=A0A6G1GMK6_9PEZI|nr:cytidine deaminase-like protein [Aulographum hederae CBS 113979]